jgi:CheY-like chemotaxis protein
MSANESVVILDDSKTFISATVAALKSRGYSAVGATSLSELGECLQITNPSLLLVDENMPEVMGHDLVGYLRDGLKLSAPILLVSAQDEMALAAHAHNCRADGFIRKQGDAMNIITQVGHYLKGMSRRTATAPVPAAAPVPAPGVARPPSSPSKVLERLRAQRELVQASLTPLNVKIGQGDWGEVAVLLPAFKPLVLNYLDLADRELYPQLAEVAGAKQNRTADLAKLIHGNMSRISDNVRRFLETSVNRHLDREAITREWARIAAALSSRMDTEQATVYPLFERLVVGRGGRDA